MKEAIIVNLEGYIIDVDLVDDAVVGVFPIYEQPKPAGMDQEPQPEEATPPPEPEITGYKVAVNGANGLYKPRFDFAAWEAYLKALEAYNAEMADWFNTPEEERGEQPVLGQFVFWVEGLTPEELEAIRNPPPGPPSIPEQVEQLQVESVETMLALTEVYETNTVQDAAREQEGVDTMLALTEAYELILQQQSELAALAARVAELEGGGN